MFPVSGMIKQVSHFRLIFVAVSYCASSRDGSMIAIQRNAADMFFEEQLADLDAQLASQKQVQVVGLVIVLYKCGAVDT